MTTPIQTTTTGALPLTAGATAGAGPQGDLHDVAEQFEAMLLRQLLTAAKMGGSGSYADMAVDALANGITEAGGVGLSRQLEATLGTQISAIRGTPSISHSSPEDDGRSAR